ncbi:unnamed protein product [Candidula unifasciata]|uniref:Ectonucleotide pyrophosphatase/phosphodiesterase family member 5 n=1 Tax=Candidula unifasciata TaxID=100452 RepID=A0A8S3YQW7_9EUPU|nr:unnamed protein product [Candidula unifasciata]
MAMLFSLILLLVNLQKIVCHIEKDLPLLLISFDGFRWDYLSRTDTPNFDRIIKNGVTAKQGIKSVFVTNTLPNHWSLVTGLYTESHGVLDNYIKDPRISKAFLPKYKDANYQNDPRYYDDGAEPIWVANQLQKQGRSGSVMWWGSENPVKWVRPTYQMPYNDAISSSEKVDTMIQWLTGEYPVNLGLVYFPEPDHTAHMSGPESADVTEQISIADSIVGYLLDKLEKKGLLDDINIIITSDHGFTNVSASRLIQLESIVSSSDYELLTESPVASIFPVDGQLESVYSKLKANATSADSHFKVYKAEEIPERFHYKNHPRRVPPIIAIADLGYSFVSNTSREFTLAGSHGYDNDYQDMHPFFVAMGPSFRQGFSVDTFNTVDVYPLMCHLLHLKPAPNNGSMEVVALLLRENEENTMWTFGTYILVLITTASVGSVFSVAACRQHRYLKRKIIQLKLSPAQATIKYSLPGKGGVQASLLSAEDDEDEDDFDDANDGDNILEIVSKR